jgi:L-alanine-DL-glutamate epimerase-like enolase superfamily enzyme
MARILDATVSFKRQRFITPLQLSSGIIESLTQALAAVVVEFDGRRATGHGTIYLSDLWAWPDDSFTHDQRDAVLRRVSETIAGELPRQFAQDDLHPLEIGLRLHDLACHGLTFTPNPSALARAMCASPFDAAIHDGAGIAQNRSAFSLYDEAAAVPSAEDYFPGIGACRAIRDIIRCARKELPAWWIVGKSDCLGQTLVPAVQKRGYRCFKLKITGRNNEADVARTVEVFHSAKANGFARPRLSIDSNEANPSAESVLDYVGRLRAVDREAYDALEYIEQPTDRDIERHTFDWREVTKQKPVMLDEGLTDLRLLEEARRQGYSGLALKTCKGHSMLLTSAAWALRNNMIISLQDLTNPGIGLIHAALVGSHLPTINGAEVNSPQFTPAANAEFLPRLESLFEPRQGVHQLPQSIPIGLGSQL